MPRFIGNCLGKKFNKPKRQDLIFLNTNSPVSFSTNPIHGFWQGATVTYVAMQLAYWMGFKKVLLVGIDHDFEAKGVPGKIITLENGDPNHFRPDYFPRGFKWQLPDLAGSELAYRMAESVFLK